MPDSVLPETGDPPLARNSAVLQYGAPEGGHAGDGVPARNTILPAGPASVTAIVTRPGVAA